MKRTFKGLLSAIEGLTGPIPVRIYFINRIEAYKEFLRQAHVALPTLPVQSRDAVIVRLPGQGQIEVDAIIILKLENAPTSAGDDFMMIDGIWIEMSNGKRFVVAKPHDATTAAHAVVTVNAVF